MFGPLEHARDVSLRFQDARECHKKHYNIALRRGDFQGLAVACNNIGYLKYYNPKEHDDSVAFQGLGYYLANKVGDVTRKGMVLTKTGKLYTNLGHYRKAIRMFQSAVECAKLTNNVAREGMAWGDLGTVYRSLSQFDEAIKCHVIYRENASKRLDVGGVAIMQHQLALDFLLKGDLPEAERSILDCFQTLEKIRSQLGDEDESKISNFEKNQAEAHNLLQVVLTAQGRYKEAFVFSDRSRTRALAEIIQTRLSRSEPESEQTRRPQCNDDFDPDASRTSAGSLRLNPANVEEYFENAVTLSKKLASTLITYSIVKEFYAADKSEEWVYTWVLPPSGDLHFSKSRLDESLTSTEVQRDEQCVFSLRSVHGGSSQLQQALRSIQSKRAAPAANTSLRPGYSLPFDLEGVEDLLSCDDVLTEPHHDCAEETSPFPKVLLDPAEPETGDKEASFEGSSPEEATISQESYLGKGENTTSSESDVISRPSKTGANVSEEPLEKSAESEHSSSIDDHTDPTTEISSVESAEGSGVGDESVPSETQVGDSAEEVEKNKNSCEEEWKPLLKSTYRVLIEPIIEKIALGALEDSPRVTFIPQDFLLRVPFAALYEERSDSYLVDKFVISTSPSVHLLDLTVEYLNRLQNDTTADNLSLLAIGNPLMPFEELPPLPAAEEEVCAIAEILSGSSNEIALGGQATKDHVTSVMRDFRILHFATHAAVDVSDAHGDFTHRGFIVLAKSDEQCNGFLTAEEVRRMKLSAELVVLSCCDSGLGKVTGEGVLGMLVFLFFVDLTLSLPNSKSTLPQGVEERAHGVSFENIDRSQNSVRHDPLNCKPIRFAFRMPREILWGCGIYARPPREILLLGLFSLRIVPCIPRGWSSLRCGDLVEDKRRLHSSAHETLLPRVQRVARRSGCSA